MKLYNFHSSSTSFRVRAALNLKGLSYESHSVNLRWQNSDTDAASYKAFNPQANVPVLVDEHAELVQSLAIIEYLEETHPDPPLLPGPPVERARVRALSLWVACEIQPLNNLRTQRVLGEMFAPDPPTLSRWQLSWCEKGFDVLERQLLQSSATGRFCHGNSPTMADCCVVPQVYNSLRPVVGADLKRWPTLARIYAACLGLDAFQNALPTNQPDFENPIGH